VKYILVAAIMLSAGRAVATPTCARAGAGAMRSTVTAKLYARHHATLDIAGAKRCRVDRWSDRAIACYARLADREPSDRASRRCMVRLTVQQKIGLRDALRAEMERIEQQIEARQLRQADLG
jgi:hypothetical protein